jgi:hypothetical protein
VQGYEKEMEGMKSEQKEETKRKRFEEKKRRKKPKRFQELDRAKS